MESDENYQYNAKVYDILRPTLESLPPRQTSVTEPMSRMSAGKILY